MKWQIVRTESGYHARLLAANGEPIMWSETYVSPASARYAITLVPATFNAETVEEIDER